MFNLSPIHYNINHACYSDGNRIMITISQVNEKAMT